MRRLLLITIILICSVSIYFLILSTGQTEKLSEYYDQILLINGILVLILIMILLKSLWDLRKNKKIFGNQLTARLVLMFSIVAIIPPIILFAVSARFITQSIDSWFSNDVENALNRSLNISKSILTSELNNSVIYATKLNSKIINSLSKGEDLQNSIVNILEGNNIFNQIAIYDFKSRELIAKAVNSEVFKKRIFSNWPELSNELGRDLVENTIFSENLFLLGKIYSQVWIRLPVINGEEYIAFFRNAIPESVNNDVIIIEDSKAKYAGLKFMKEGLRYYFLITLIIVTLMSLVLSMLIAIYLSKIFISPLLALAKATSAVSKGDFTKKSPIIREDELGLLTARFNRMTDQLRIAEKSAKKLYQEQEKAKTYLESVLSNLNSGVITVDNNGHIKTYNRSAEKITQLKLENVLGKTSEDLINNCGEYKEFGRFINLLMQNKLNENHIEFEFNTSNSRKILLGKARPMNLQNGLVIVFEDVSKLVLAQKEAAWGEVARRFAHEIKNPLTPIQLSAERLSLKLEDKLNKKDAEILHKSTNTIIHQVAALKDMVESFRDYSKSASLKFSKEDFTKILKEVLVLYENSEYNLKSEILDRELKVNMNINSIRQVLHNILKNAVEAVSFDEEPYILVKTEVKDGMMYFTVTNNGKKFDKKILNNVFDPYVTNKIGGTGLGLTVVKKIIEEHKGYISVGNSMNYAWIRILLKLVG